MRLLLDNDLSPALVEALTASGWDVQHVADLDLRAAPDHEVLGAARDDGRILVSADTDFGAIRAASRASSPSVVLLRRTTGRRVPELARILTSNLPTVEAEPNAGSVVVTGDDSPRIRRLPIA